VGDGAFQPGFSAELDEPAHGGSGHGGADCGRGVWGDLGAAGGRLPAGGARLVFAVFFLFEITAGLRIHPLQYALVGAALCLFFLGFLALSEFLSTGLAYSVASGACTLLVALYAWTFLRTGARTLLIGGGLGATYGYLYFVLRSQDYALLAGTAALFVALALVMWGTRRINWYALDPARSAAGGS
jgi:inner membrane protein